MGMFDNVRCLYPLPIAEATGLLYQTKDTPAQYLDMYEIREDGTLWHEAWDCRIEETPDAPLGFWEHRDNPRWERVVFDGEISIYGNKGPVPYRFRLWFRDGVVRDVIQVRP